jgi:hypothetical protein
MRNQKPKYKDIILFSLLTAGVGFLFGDLIIGGIIWFIQSIRTGDWGSAAPLGIQYGTIFGLVGLVIGPILVFTGPFLKRKK